MTAPAPGTKEFEEVQPNRDLLFYFCVSRAPPAAHPSAVHFRRRTCVVFVPKAPHRLPLARFIEKSRTKTTILCSGKRGLESGSEEIGSRKRKRDLPANHRAGFQNANTS